MSIENIKVSARNEQTKVQDNNDSFLFCNSVTLTYNGNEESCFIIKVFAELLKDFPSEMHVERRCSVHGFRCQKEKYISLLLKQISKKGSETYLIIFLRFLKNLTLSVI